MVIPLHKFDLTLGGYSYYPVGEDCLLYQAYWDRSVVDHSSKGNDGSISGAVFGVNGLSFDGVDDYVNCGTDVSLNFGIGDMSFMIWANLPHLDNTTFHPRFTLFSKYDGNVGIWIYKEAGEETPNYGFLAKDGTNQTSTAIAVGHSDEWELFVLTLDRDGKAIGYVPSYSYSFELESWDTDGSINTADPLLIGINHIGSDQEELGGVVGEALIFNRVLSSDEIINYFNVTKARYGL